MAGLWVIGKLFSRVHEDVPYEIMFHIHLFRRGVCVHFALERSEGDDEEAGEIK